MIFSEIKTIGSCLVLVCSHKIWFVYATLSHITVLTHILAIVTTVPYWWGDSNMWIRLRYSTAWGHILTVRSMAIAVYGTVDSPILYHAALLKLYSSVKQLLRTPACQYIKIAKPRQHITSAWHWLGNSEILQRSCGSQTGVMSQIW